jgi:hypothetical protein
MAEDDDIVGIMAMPIDFEGAHIVAGSKVVTANHCGHEVYLAPSTADMIEKTDLPVVICCLRCVQPEWLSNGIKATPGAQEELNQEMGEEETSFAFWELGVEVVEPPRRNP